MIDRHRSDGKLDVADVAIVLARDHQERKGLLAWAAVRVGPFRFDGLAIRRRLDGEVIITYPAKKDARGGVHHAITPLDPELDRRIRATVIAAYIKTAATAGRGAR